MRADVRVIDTVKRAGLSRLLLESVVSTAPGEKLDEKLAALTLPMDLVECKSLIDFGPTVLTLSLKYLLRARMTQLGGMVLVSLPPFSMNMISIGVQIIPTVCFLFLTQRLWVTIVGVTLLTLPSTPHFPLRLLRQRMNYTRMRCHFKLLSHPHKLSERPHLHPLREKLLTLRNRSSSIL